ncbi:MAG: DUF7079 family protein [Caldimonas sp.]
MTSAERFAAPRVAAWQALSELFLDTELDDADIASIARRLKATGLGVDDLERIYETEVAPACWRNLEALPGGEWTGFSPAWLTDAIGGHLDRARGSRAWSRDSWLGRWRIARRTASTRADWERLRRLLVADGDV